MLSKVTKQPEKLMHLLGESDCQPLHLFLQRSALALLYLSNFVDNCHAVFLLVPNIDLLGIARASIYTGTGISLCYHQTLRGIFVGSCNLQTGTSACGRKVSYKP